MTTFSILEDGKQHAVEATLAGDGGIRVTHDSLRSALGWELKPQGWCRGDVCVPSSDVSSSDSDGVDLERFARTLNLPLAVDADERTASLGRSSVEHAGVLASGEAPDFTLPDLSGTHHTLSNYRGKKILLIAYASW